MARMSLFELIPLPFGGYFFRGIPPEYTDVESTLSVFMICATLFFGFAISALMGDHGDEVEVAVTYFYQATACFGYNVMLILCTYMYFTTHVHQDNAAAMKAEMWAFRYPWAILVTIMLLLFIIGTFLYFYALSYIRDDRVGREIAGELWVGNTWQNCLNFSLIVLVTHISFLWVRWRSSEEVEKSGLWKEMMPERKLADGACKEAEPAKDAEPEAKKEVVAQI